MRTTLTLDPDVAQLLERAMHRQHLSMKDVVNQALRRALAPTTQPASPPLPPPHVCALRPGFDLLGNNRLAEEAEDEALMAQLQRDAR